MKTHLLIFTVISLIAGPLHAGPGEQSKLGWTEVISVSQLVKQGLGADGEGMTATEGSKVELMDGYLVTATLRRGEEFFLAKLWVGLDWSRFKMGPVTHRNGPKAGQEINPPKLIEAPAPKAVPVATPIPMKPKSPAKKSPAKKSPAKK